MGLRHAAGLLTAAALVLGAPAAAAPGNGRIAYVTGGSVYSVNPAGTGAALVHSGAFPAFSPDGARIVFSDATPINGALPIMVADADGSNAHQIGSSSNPHAFVWSPDGTRIAFVTGDGQGGFSIVDLKADG